MSLLAVLETFIMKVEPEWKALHGVADKRVKQVADIYEKALINLGKSINVEELAKQPIPLMVDRIDWQKFSDDCDKAYEVLGLVLIDGGIVAAKYLSNNMKSMLDQSVKKAAPVSMPTFGGGSPEGLSLSGSFDMRNLAAVQWASQHVAENIKQVNTASRAGINEILTNAQQYGGHPYETARQIRQFIGLTDKQVKGVLNKQSKLDEEGRSKEQVDRMIDADIRKKIRARANTIARTETIAASAAGQQLHWEDQMKKGYLNNAEMEKVWIITPDDRLCPICAAMGTERTAIDGTFLFGGKAPPRHPNCRCAIGLEEKKGKELEGYMESDKGKDWTTIDQLLGLPPETPTLPSKVAKIYTDIPLSFNETRLELIAKYNKNHDRLGRFASGGGSSSGAASQKSIAGSEPYKFTIHDAHGNILLVREGKSSRVEQLHKDYLSQLKSGKHAHKPTQEAYNKAIQSGATPEQAFRIQPVNVPPVIKPPIIKPIPPVTKPVTKPPVIKPVLSGEKELEAARIQAAQAKRDAVKQDAAAKDVWARMTPDQRISMHNTKIDSMSEDHFHANVAGYLKQHGYTQVLGVKRFNDIDREKDFVKQTIMLQEKYPTQRKLAFVEVCYDFGPADKHTYAWYTPSQHSIQLNLECCGTKDHMIKQYAKDVRTKFHPQDTGADSILVHEYGHAVHFDMKRRAVDWDNKQEERDRIRLALGNVSVAYEKHGGDISKEIGKYATKDENEMFAEAFVQMHNHGANENKFTKIISSTVKEGELLTKLFKKEEK